MTTGTEEPQKTMTNRNTGFRYVRNYGNSQQKARGMQHKCIEENEDEEPESYVYGTKCACHRVTLKGKRAL